MKAILFSNFPLDLTENTFKPRLADHNIEVIRTANIDRSPTIDVSGADVLVAMVELMSGGQRAKIKKLASTTGKRYVALSRKTADWAREFASVHESMKKEAPLDVPKRTGWEPRIVPTPPESAPAEKEVEHETELLVATTEELQSMLAMYEQDNESLLVKIQGLEANSRADAEKDLIERLKASSDELKNLRSGLDKTKLERDQMTLRVGRLKKEVEEANVAKAKTTEEAQKELGAHVLERKKFEQSTAADKKLEEHNVYLVTRTEALVQQVAGLETQVAESLGYVAKAQNEVQILLTTLENIKAEKRNLEELTARQGENLFKMQKAATTTPSDDGELKRLREEVSRLRVVSLAPVSSRTTVRATEDFLKVREAFKTLWRSGALGSEEVLSKLMAWEPKEP